jgi:hypothetical protein
MTTPSLTMPTVLRLQPPAWRRGWDALRMAWSAARTRAAERRLIRATLSATTGLDDATRRDLGLPERPTWQQMSSTRSIPWPYY